MNPAERDVKILSGTWTRNVFQTLNQSKTSLNHSVWSKYIRFFKYFQVKKYFQLQSNIPVLRLVRRIGKCTSVIGCFSQFYRFRISTKNLRRILPVNFLFELQILHKDRTSMKIPNVIKIREKTKIFNIRNFHTRPILILGFEV